MSSYVFVLSPPYSGSTVLWKLIATSSAVSSLPSEGQFLPEVMDVMREDPWNADLSLPWARIKQVWDGYWDHGKPLLLEKSPPNLIRTADIVEHFKPAYFVVMVRDPYAHCEGLMRRNSWDAVTAAEFSARCLRRQAQNAEELKNAVHFTYEQLADDPGAIAERIRALIPEIDDLDTRSTFSVHSVDGTVDRAIVNLNSKKMRRLSPRDLRIITGILEKNSDLMTYWGYEYLTTSIGHMSSYWIQKGRSTASGSLRKGKAGARRILRTLATLAKPSGR
jgi:sulfotransferase family protein